MKQIYLYSYKTSHPRTGAFTGLAFGIVQAETEEGAKEILWEKMGRLGYELRLTEVTDYGAEGFYAFPAGMFMGYEPR